MILLNSTNSSALGEDIASYLGINFENVSSRIFPDGETYIRISNDLQGKEVFIVQTMFPDPNNSLTEFLLIADTAKDLGAKKITGIIPYMAYARQDRIFQTGEALSMKTVTTLLKSVGVDYLITVDTHYQHVPHGKFNLFGLDAINISAGRLLIAHIKDKINKDLITIGPDFGSSEMVKYATGEEKVFKKEKICPICGLPATQCKCDTKDKEYIISDVAGDFDFKNKNVVILDDIIASGGTMIQTVKKVKSEGARNIIIAATHGLFLKDSLNTLRALTDYLVVTDSISTPVSNVSVAPLIGAIKTIS